MKKKIRSCTLCCQLTPEHIAALNRLVEGDRIEWAAASYWQDHYARERAKEAERVKGGRQGPRGGGA